MARTVLTYADYEALPNDGQHYQVLDGELFVTATPNTSHQMAVGNLFIVFVGADRLDLISKRGIEGAPTPAGDDAFTVPSFENLVIDPAEIWT